VVDGTTNFLIPQTGWLLHYVDSEELVGADGAAINAFDGHPASIWHTEWKLKKTPPPHEIQIDLGTVYDLGGFRYLPRQDNGTNGIISQYALYVSVDGLNWGTPVSEGTFVSGSAEKEVLFPTTTGRFVSFVGLRDINNSLFTSVAELNFLGGLHEGN
jgi:hypothetical protein